MQISSNDVENFLNQNEDDYPFSGVTCNDIFNGMMEDFLEFLENERKEK
ncbi:hypothetical protein LCGC14_1125370 [marine sediment metagenome]|uniref:Uncharacterized protein n=1 Tax=marine sediment metagenome TaxID=412755 RepID=A0A0F9MQN0_9ZZZZ